MCPLNKSKKPAPWTFAWQAMATDAPENTTEGGPMTAALGQTRPRRPPLRGAYARPVVPSKRTHTGRLDRGSLGPRAAVAQTQETLRPAAALRGQAGVCEFYPPPDPVLFSRH